MANRSNVGIVVDVFQSSLNFETGNSPPSKTFKATILARNQVLYEDIESVRQLETFFRQAIETAYVPSVKST